MRKIPSVWKRDYEGTRLVYDEVVPGSEWVLAGEGIATVKFDGTACMVRGGRLFKRYDAKRGKTPPPGWEPCEPEPDPKSGHWPGWLPVGEGGPEDRWLLEAWIDHLVGDAGDGTYELVGPKVQGGAEGYVSHRLLLHGNQPLPDCPRDFLGVRDFLESFRFGHPPRPIEGIVWHHPDGRMAKIKRRDFGLSWPPPKGAA